MKQLKCNHTKDWHPTERGMLKPSAKPNTTVRKIENGEVPLWKCPLCDEGLFIDPRSCRKGREESTWSSKTSR